jgi:uncharacterized protein (TIGR02996 family)
VNMNYESLERVIKYSNWQRQDWFPALVGDGAHDHHKALVFADWLDEHGGEPELAEKVRREAHKSLALNGRPLKPNRLGDNYTLADFVLHAIRTGHPSPTVRAMSGKAPSPTNPLGEPPHPQLSTLLLRSSHAADQDVGAFLALPDPEPKAGHPHLKRLNTMFIREAGLEAKQVDGTVYLMDHEDLEDDGHQQRRSFGAPEIRFTADAKDPQELAAMEAHAHQIASARAGLEGVAHMGPAH